jgi:hypothetical protein
MYDDTLLSSQSSTHRIEALYKALMSVGEMDVKPLRGDSWFDDLYVTGHGPEDDMNNENWMDDLDEAA